MSRKTDPLKTIFPYPIPQVRLSNWQVPPDDEKIGLLGTLMDQGD